MFVARGARHFMVPLIEIRKCQKDGSWDTENYCLVVLQHSFNKSQIKLFSNKDRETSQFKHDICR